MRRFSITAIIFLWCASLLGQATDVRGDESAAPEAEIKTLELKLAELIVRGAWDEYTKFLASDYIHTRENGIVESKDEALARLRDAKHKIIVMEMEPTGIAIRIYGDTAVMNAEFTITLRDSGQVRSRRSRLTDVFVKREGGWFLIAGQETAISK